MDLQEALFHKKGKRKKSDNMSTLKQSPHILRLGRNTGGKKEMTLSQPSNAPNRIPLRPPLRPLPLIDLLLLLHTSFMYLVLCNNLRILFRRGYWLRFSRAYHGANNLVLVFVLYVNGLCLASVYPTPKPLVSRQSLREPTSEGAGTEFNNQRSITPTHPLSVHLHVHVWVMIFQAGKVRAPELPMGAPN